MLDVKILLHEVNGAQRPTGGDFSSLKTDLADLYETCGIQLEVADGRLGNAALPEGTIHHDALRDQIRHSTDPVAGVGHLILAAGASLNDFPSNALGALLDTRHRDVAAVFGSRIDKPELYLQTCGHEIGHMFDLRHQDGNASVPTAMRQTSERRKHSTEQGFADAWQQVAPQRPPGLAAFPFNGRAVTRIEKKPDRRQPGGGKFHPGSPDDVFDLLDLRLEPEWDEGRAEESFGFHVVLTNPLDRAVAVPRLLRPQLGNLLLRVTWPDDTSFFYRPVYSVCYEDYEVLEPGETRVHPQVLMRGLRHHLFPAPGRFGMEVCRADRQPAAGFEVEVQPRRDQPLSRSFSRYLNQGAPRRQTHHSRTLNAMLRAGDPSRDPFLAHLALLKARRLKAPKPANELLSAVERSEAPLAVRHAAFLERFARASDASRLELLDTADELFDDPRLDLNLYYQMESILDATEGDT